MRERIGAIYHQDSQKAHFLIKDHNFRSATIVRRIFSYALPDQLVKAKEAHRQLQKIVNGYLEKFGPKTFEMFAKAILTDNDQQLNKLCRHVEKYDALAEILSSLQKRLQIRQNYFPELQRQLQRQDIAKADPQTIWQRVAPKGIEFSASDRYWSLGYIYTKYRLWDNAAKFFELAAEHSPSKVEKAEIYVKYIGVQKKRDKAQSHYRQLGDSYREALGLFDAGENQRSPIQIPPGTATLDWHQPRKSRLSRQKQRQVRRTRFRNRQRISAQIRRGSIF